MTQVEREILVRVFKDTNGNIAEAARRLQVDYKTLHGKMRRYRIAAAQFRLRKADKGDSP